MGKWRAGVDLEALKQDTEDAFRKGNWRHLPIQENEEPLLLVPPEFCYPWYAVEMGFCDDPRIYLRRTVYNMFLVAHGILRSWGYDLMIYDGWRSITLQEALFWHYLKEFSASKFDIEHVFAGCSRPADIKSVFLGLCPEVKCALLEENFTYVSWPSNDPSCPHPHATGGAVDVWLYQDGRPINMGVPFDWMDREAGAFYHRSPNVHSLGANHETICAHREALQAAMAAVGFSCYAAEFWHFNFGNQMDALVSKNDALYSYIEPEQLS